MKIFDTKEESCFGIVYENLSLPDRENRIIFHDGKFLSESNNHRYPKYTFFDYYKDYYSDSFLKNYNVPYLIITACGSWPHLDKIMYSEDIKNYLNTVGLEIYLYETIFIDISDSKRPFVNSLKFDSSREELFNIIKPSVVGFESTYDNISKMYCFEFENLKKFIIKNNLKKVTVYTGDYNIEKHFKNSYPEMTLATQDIFLTSLFRHSDSRFTSYEYNSYSTPPSSETILYKFWCGNRRYDGYRQLVAAYLLNMSALCSYQTKIEDSPFVVFDDRKDKSIPIWGKLENYLWFDLDKWKTDCPEIYSKIRHQLNIMPNSLSIDTNIESEVALESLPVPVSSYQQCFCSVITEARFAYPMGQFSEKTLNAIKSFRPFILVAPPRTLEYMQSYGIQTFDEFWDESYDQEENHESRLIKIFRIIDYINSFSIDELKELYIKMLPILEHNYRIIQNISKFKYNG